jgi:hypothetical protein
MEVVILNNLKGDYILDTDYKVRLRLGPQHLCQGLVEFSLFHFHLTRMILMKNKGVAVIVN